MLLTLLACDMQTYDVADLQLDLEGAMPVDAELMHVCIADQLEHEEGAGNGRVAVPGLWADRDAEVRIELYNIDGEQLLVAGPIVFGDAWQVAPVLEPDGLRCAVDKDKAPTSAETWLLGIRFSEE